MNSPLLHQMREAIEEDLRFSLASLKEEAETEMVDMITYHLGWNVGENQSTGKRIRPLLSLLCCASLGGDWKTALPTASAIELIHNFSLVHDDIQDNSETRRGRPTLWKQWGIAKAINLGDSIFVLSRLACYRLNNTQVTPDRIIQVLRVLDEACLELTIGQQMDLSFEELEFISLETYLRMIQGKTSALIAAAATCGGLIAEANDSKIKILYEYGYHLGMAFQIRDDILGIWGETSKTGKAIYDDLRSRKKTLPILYGLSKSKEFRNLWESQNLDDQTLKAMHQSLDDTKAHQYCIEEVETHTDAALTALNSFGGKDPYQEELNNLTASLLHRDQ